MNFGYKVALSMSSNVVDAVASAFKVTLEENCVTTSSCPLEDVKRVDGRCGG